MKRRMLTLLVAYFPGYLLALYTFDVHHRETTRNIIIAMGHGIWDVTFSVAMSMVTVGASRLLLFRKNKANVLASDTNTPHTHGD